MQAPRKEKLQEKETWQDKIKRSRYLFGAILFHLILFVLLATWVIFEAPPPPPTDEFRGVTVKIPPPPVQPPTSGAAANNPHFEPQPVVVPVVTPPSVITTINSSFTVDAPKIMNQSLSHVSSRAAQGTGLSSGSGGGSGSGSGSGFGTTTGSNDLLQGTLYDLKQTPDGKPTGMDPGKYHQIISQFVQGNWSPSVLEQYYKAKKPLFTSFIFIPTIDAADGPKAFGVEKEVQPLMYVVWYKVTATPPEDGTYHFVGIGDDILAVRVDGKTVLDACLATVDDDVRQSEKQYAINNYEPGRLNDGANPNGAHLYIGRPFHATSGQPVDIDVLIGEEPGGKSNYFLFMQRDETTYQNQSNGTPLLPIFQLGTNPAKPEGDSSGYPAYSHNAEPWGPAPSQ